MSNPVRTCIGCAGKDDHPRHTTITADGAEVGWHMDCHKIATGCEICAGQLAGAKGAQGDKLRAHLITLGPGADQPGWTAPADETPKES